MRKEDRIRFSLLKDEPKYLENILSCEKFLERIFENNDNRIYVAVSGGKDSMVMLDLSLKVWTRYPETFFCIWHWDYGENLVPRTFAKEIINNINSLIWRYSFPSEQFIVDKRFRQRSAREDSVFGYHVFYFTIKKIILKYSFTHALIGLRKNESSKRMLFLKEKTIHSRKISNEKKILDCYPLANFSAQEIWTYIVTNNIPYPSTYDLLAKFRPYEEIRFVTFFDKEFTNINQTDDFFFWREKQ